MIGETVWLSISLAWYAASLAVAVVALSIRQNSTKPKQRNETTTLNVKRERNSYTTPHIGNKPSGLDRQLPPATYAVSPSNQETLSKPITSTQETQTQNSNLHIDDATPVGAVPHSPSQIGRQPAQANVNHSNTYSKRHQNQHQTLHIVCPTPTRS
jgi:hypothetical protein